MLKNTIIILRKSEGVLAIMINLTDDLSDAQITCPVCCSVFFVRDEIGKNMRQLPIHGNCNGAGRKVITQPLKDARAKQECKEFYKRLTDILLT